MSFFYIITEDTTSIEATNPKEASRLYALQNELTSGKVTVVTNTKVFDIVATPRDVQVTEVP